MFKCDKIYNEVLLKIKDLGYFIKWYTIFSKKTCFKYTHYYEINKNK